MAGEEDAKAQDTAHIYATSHGKPQGVTSEVGARLQRSIDNPHLAYCLADGGFGTHPQSLMLVCEGFCEALSVMQDPDVCWICLDDSGPLASACECPNRLCHPDCLARWQLQSAGSRYESVGGLMVCTSVWGSACIRLTQP